MKKLIVMMAVAITAAMPIVAATETIGGYTWTYRINNGTAEIYNNGSNAISPKPNGAVTIPSTLGGKPVTSIGSVAFSSCYDLTSVTIPDSVTSIGASTFNFCYRLASVTIGSGVTSIGDDAFDGCSGLTSVTMPDSVRSIGDYAFCDCSKLTIVMIPDNVTNIGKHAFSGCSDLANVTIGNSVTNIGSAAFSNCSGLTNVTFGSGVTSIGSSAFASCRGLTNVTIPDSVTSIKASVFFGCGLVSVTIPNSVTSIGDYAFSDCSDLTSVTIGNSVTSIGDEAFTYCSGLTSITFKGNAPSVGSWVFDGVTGCTAYVKRTASGFPAEGNKWNGLTIACLPESPMLTIVDGVLVRVDMNGYKSVEIPSTVTAIAAGAFAGCADMESVKIPDSVTSIPAATFANCDKLWSSWYKTIANGGTAATDKVTLAVTNVVMHYVTASVQSDAVTPPETTGLVNVIAEVTSGGPVAISSTWAEQYPDFETKFGNDFTAALTKPTGKRDGSGNAMLVWQDYVAGTDPTDPDSRFTASITFDAQGKPVISYSPELSTAEAEKRTYRKFGKARLNDANWTEIAAGEEENYNFFKVTVEMK